MASRKRMISAAQLMVAARTFLTLSTSNYCIVALMAPLPRFRQITMLQLFKYEPTALVWG